MNVAEMDELHGTVFPFGASAHAAFVLFLATRP
jgi:hypothetical protein